MIPGISAPLLGPVSMSIPFEPESAARVREALASWLDHRGSASDVVDDARLVATELVGNAVRHASPLGNGTVLVRWQEEGSVLAMSVCDGGGVNKPQRVDASPDALGGRGLSIVEALASRWWSERNTDVHTVHVRLPID